VPSWQAAPLPPPRTAARLVHFLAPFTLFTSYSCFTFHTDRSIALSAACSFTHPLSPFSAYSRQTLYPVSSACTTTRDNGANAGRTAHAGGSRRRRHSNRRDTSEPDTSWLADGCFGGRSHDGKPALQPAPSRGPPQKHDKPSGYDFAASLSLLPTAPR